MDEGHVQVEGVGANVEPHRTERTLRADSGMCSGDIESSIGNFGSILFSLPNLSRLV